MIIAVVGLVELAPLFHQWRFEGRTLLPLSLESRNVLD